MSKFVHQQNLAHFRKLLVEPIDQTKRQQVLKLLAEEKAKDQESFRQGRIALPASPKALMYTP